MPPEPPKPPKVRIAYGLPSVAARQSSLMPLTGQTAVDDLLQSCAAVSRQWTARLYALAAAGWDALEMPETGRELPSGVLLRPWDIHARRLRIYAECPPPGVLAHKRWVCNRFRVCPWCYGRTVVGRVAEDLILARGMADSRVMGVIPPLTIVCFRHTWTIDLAATPLEQVLQAVPGALRKDPQALTAAGIPFFGWRASLTLAPATPEQPDQLCSRRTTFMLIPASQMYGREKLATAMPESAALAIRSVSLSADRAELAALLAWGLPYPVGMMRNHVGLTVVLLNRLGQTRLRTSACGLLMSLRPVRADVERSAKAAQLGDVNHATSTTL